MTPPWVGQILHIDLATGRVEVLSPFPYAYSYLGGRGLAARFAWDMIPPGTMAFDPAAPLMFMPGALVGTPAPSSGRVTISGLSPQAYPHEWFTRSNLGGHWGAELKYAGWDGLIVTGRAPSPVYLCIDDDQIEVREADGLWGAGLVETQLRFRRELGAEWRVLAIGPAGERLCRFAVIATGTESAAGQGGFGAVMGSKNLKAIAVRGSRGVPIAQPREMLRRSRQVVGAIQRRYGEPSLDTGTETPYADRRRPSPCTSQCPRSCGGFYRNIPGSVHSGRAYSGQLFCCAPLLVESKWLGTSLTFEAGFEIAQLCNDLGLNHWELVFGLVPWMLRCQKRGELEHLNGESLDFSSPDSWVKLVHRIAFREGYGDVLAEGGPRAASLLSVGEDIIGELYPAWGQASHWDGHGSFPMPYFPFWLVTALQWALDTRDPMGGGHGYTTNIVGLVRTIGSAPGDDPAWQKLALVGESLYGSAVSVDPRSGYEGKAAAAIFHQDRGALKDSLGICDNIFPLLTDPNEADFMIRVDGIEGKLLEHYLFQPASTLDIAADAFYRIGSRIYTLERLLAMRNWGRSRATDETILPYLRHPEGGINPYLLERVDLDVARFRALLDEYYVMRGWDPATGYPTQDALRDLELDGLGVVETDGPPQATCV